MVAVRKRNNHFHKRFLHAISPLSSIVWTNTLKLMPLAEPEVDLNVKHSNKQQACAYFQ